MFDHHQNVLTMKYKVFISSMLMQVITRCIKMEKGWETVGHAPRQIITLQKPEDGVKAEMERDIGDGWKITCEGQSVVNFHNTSTWLPLYNSVILLMKSEYILYIIIPPLLYRYF